MRWSRRAGRLGCCISGAHLFDQAERYRSLGRMYRKSPRDVGAEHQALAEAVLARNVARACDLGEKHIRSTVDNVVA